MGFDDVFWGDLRDGCADGYTMDPWDQMRFVEGAPCSLPLIWIRLPSMICLVFGSLNFVLATLCFLKLVWLRAYTKHPVDVAFMLCNVITVACDVLTFGFPSHITNLQTTAIPAAFGWLVHVSGLFTLLMFSSLVQVPLKAVVVLDPLAEQALDKIFKRTSLINFMVGIAWPYSFLSFGAAETQNAMANTAWGLQIAVLIWASNMSVALASTYSTLMYLPPSAKAYEEEFPAFKKQISRLRLTIFALGLFTVSVAVFAFPLIIWVVPRYFYMLCDVIVAFFQIVAFNFTYSCYSFHTNQLLLSEQAGQAMVSDAQPTTAGRGKSIAMVINGDAVQEEDTTTGVSKRGVSVQFLRQFASEFGIGKAETTDSVQSRLVRTHTKAKGCSYYSILADGKDKYGNSWRGSGQTVFVSHSWGCPFDSLVRVCAEYERKQRKADGEHTYFYIDIFVMNQWAIDGKKSSGDEDVVYRALLQTLDDSIMQCKVVLVVLNNCAHPEALTRIWCLFEVYRCITLNKKLQMAFPRSEAIRFASAVNALEINIDSLARSADVSTAQATDPYDLGMIRRNIERTIGEDLFNEMLRKKLMAHLVDCAVSTKVDSAQVRHRNQNRVSPHRSTMDFDDTESHVVRVNKAAIEHCAELKRENAELKIQMRALREQLESRRVAGPPSAERGGRHANVDSEIDELYEEIR